MRVSDVINCVRSTPAVMVVRAQTMLSRLWLEKLMCRGSLEMCIAEKW